MSDDWLTITGLFDDPEDDESPAPLQDALCAEIREEEVVAIGMITIRRLPDARNYTHFLSPNVLDGFLRFFHDR